MTYEFFRFELRQQLRSPLLWVLAIMFGLMTFAAASSDAVQIGGGVGNVNRNAPTTIAMFYGFMSLLSLFAIAAFVSNALLRDFEMGTADLFFSSPMRKRDFLVGRFAGAMAACLLVYAMVTLGLMIAPAMPWIDPERLGAFSLYPYVWSMGVLVLPNLVFIGALLALLAVTGRNLLVVYLGVIGFFVLRSLAGALVRDLDNELVSAMIDPFGLTAFARTTRYWTAPELNSRLPELAGYLLLNRALWLSVGAAMIAAAFALFKPQRTGTGRGWLRRKAKPATAPAPRAASARVAPARPAFDAATVRAQFWASVRLDAVGVFKSVPFLIMLAFAAFNFIMGASSMQRLFGTQVYPTTALMLQALQGSYSYMLVLIAMFYAGDLVFKERSARLGEVTDAMPVPNWVPMLSKFVALIAVVLAFQAIGGVAAMGVQLFKGYTALEPLLYLKGLLLASIPYVLMGGLALVLQVLCNNRFIGYGLTIAVVVAQATLGMLHFEHNLYNYANAPDAPYSDMNGYGHFLAGRLWFQGYWGLFLCALLLVAAAFWLRGIPGHWRERLRLARERLRGGPRLALAAALLAWAATGAWIFWNTNVLNRYLPSDLAMDERARYEKDYRKYKDLPQPQIVAVDNAVDLRPETLGVSASGRYTIVNPHAAPIAEFHLQVDPESKIEKLDFGGARLLRDDERLGYRIYRLDRPMQPGERRELTFVQSRQVRGFSNEPGQHAIVGNGSFFNSGAFPHFGYDPGRQLQDRNERRKRGLGDVPRMAKLEDQAARAHHYIASDADWIEFKTSICTAPDQIALSPGYLVREYEKGGRKCFDYAMDRPMLPFYSYLSARWKVKRATYPGGIAIEIYYDPKHEFNVDRMIAGTQRSLEYFQAHFTPYQHRQVRIIEFPGYETFAQSFANTIPFSESIGFVADLRDPSAIDYVFYVTAHEVAHQWWAHQVIGADQQGSTVLSESLSQYSALMVMEKEYGRAKMRRFLKYELDRYLSDRAGERVEELPLYRVENQPYIHYRKGSLVFYRLREELGEDAVNRALKRFLLDKGYQQPPYTNSAELLAYLRREARPDQQALITDLFEKIGFYDNRMLAASSKKRADGKYEVTMKLQAGKRYADGKGRETPGRMDDWIEVGVFGRGASGKEEDEKVLYLQRRRVTEGEFSVTAVVDQAPYEVGFDPYNKLIDRVPTDNRRKL
ncbi:ABC transporter permease/M1 family aminopeptidase [Lysobacter enzymogenes]|uniref:ABC transporter permease/M1 family aminopeptidase n=1 Tax=Lysobacter enzymogenes TaxID=69 RepID=UPI001AF6AA26|nr:M1 family aminopeptidase [Lysobacter enzymogenes]QQQ02973.1 ABC transporter permease subunit [Lysobacter enzymogenes]